MLNWTVIKSLFILIRSKVIVLSYLLNKMNEILKI